MSSIERKSIDRIQKGDRMLVDAGVFTKAGQKVDEKTIKLLANHNVVFVPTIRPTYEEQQKLSLEQDSRPEEKLVLRDIKEREAWCEPLRLRMLEKVKSIYIPFHESNRTFHAMGKKKQLIPDKLLEGNLPSLYQADTDAGSESLISPADLRFLMEVINTITRKLESLTYLGPDTRKQKHRIRRLNLNSVRLHSLFSGSRLSTVGDATAWHVVDTAIYFLFTLINMNKKRILKGCPLSTARFDPDKPVDDATEFQYYPGTICDTILGILMHKTGDFHESIHGVLSEKPVLDPDNPASANKIRLLQRSGNVTRNLLKNRRDISSIARMICFMQHEHADGTGFPPLNENKYLHELVRIFHVIDYYDSMTNPVRFKTPFSRFDVIEYMKEHSGEYKYSKNEFIPQPRFDRNLLGEFLQILAPYALGEKVYLYPAVKRNEYYFVGRVVSYLDSHIPLISILVDRRNNKKYRYGEMIFDIPSGTAILMENSKITKKTTLDWIRELRIFDLSVNPGHISEHQDPLFHKQRILARRFRK